MIMDWQKVGSDEYQSDLVHSSGKNKESSILAIVPSIHIAAS